MGRRVRRIGIGTKEKFDQYSKKHNFQKIENAEIYWDDDGIFAIVADQKWADYLTHKD